MKLYDRIIMPLDYIAGRPYSYTQSYARTKAIAISVASVFINQRLNPVTHSI